MITISEISEQIIHSKNFNTDDDFVAAAVKLHVTSGEAIHAGLLIHYRRKCYLLQYTSADVRISDVPSQWYFHKPLKVIPQAFIASFLTYCQKVVEKANPDFGYVYGGSIYDENGIFFSNKGIPEILTCVGFCINVVVGFIEADEYISFSDWTISSIDSPDDYIAYFKGQYANLLSNEAYQELIKSIRRIKPSEFLTSAFVDGSLPIRKATIDEILQMVEQALVDKKPEEV